MTELIRGRASTHADTYPLNTTTMIRHAARTYPEQEIVYRTADETYGELIVATVTPVEGKDVTLESIREFAAEYIADYKLPREIVVREIRRNPSGEILKHVIRKQLAND